MAFGKRFDFIKGRLFVAGFIVVSIHFTLNEAQAQYFTGPISSALGRAGRGSGDTAEGTFLNPAILAHAPPFEAAGYFSTGESPAGEDKKIFGLTVVDNSPDVVLPGALSYIQTKTNRQGQPTITEKYWQAAFGKFYVPQLSIGFSLNYLEQEVAGERGYDQWNGSLGLLYVPRPVLGIGLSYNNFISASDEVPESLQLVPTLGLGFNYLYLDFLRFRMDVTRPDKEWNPLEKFNYHVGVESKAGSFFVIRVGHEWNRVNENQILTAGLGFVGPRLKVDYSYEKSQESGSGALHSVDLRMGF